VKGLKGGLVFQNLTLLLERYTFLTDLPRLIIEGGFTCL
jgi:hypothetical protein